MVQIWLESHKSYISYSTKTEGQTGWKQYTPKLRLRGGVLINFTSEILRSGSRNQEPLEQSAKINSKSALLVHKSALNKALNETQTIHNLKWIIDILFLLFFNKFIICGLLELAKLKEYFCTDYLWVVRVFFCSIIVY